MKIQFLLGLLLAATAGTFSLTIAATPPPARVSETSVATSQFAASHQRIKAKLTPEDREILDQLSAKVRKALPRNAQIPADVIKILSASTRAFSHDEIEALASYVSGEISGARSGSADNSLLQATQQMQETQISFNLQYLQLQSEMQNENRSYTAVSNIMKTKHDTAKNTISNIH